MAKIEKKKKSVGRRFLSAVGGTMARMPGVVYGGAKNFIDAQAQGLQPVIGAIDKTGRAIGGTIARMPNVTWGQAGKAFLGPAITQRGIKGVPKAVKDVVSPVTGPIKTAGKAIMGGAEALNKPTAGSAMTLPPIPAEQPAPQATPIPAPQAMPQKQTGAMGVPTSMLYRTSSAEALKKLFPGSDAAARAYGLRTTGQMQAAEPGSVQAASLEAERLRGKARTIGSPTVRREVERQAAELERQAPRARELEARQKMVETQVAGEMAKAMAGDQMAMETLKAQYYKSDAATKSKMFGDMLKGLNPDGTMEPAEYLTKANELAQQLGIGAGAEQGAEQGVEGGISAIGELAGYDTNQDGLLDGDEAKSALDFANTVMAKYNTLTPEQQTAAKTDPKFINAQAILAAVKQKASKKAKQVIG